MKFRFQGPSASAFGYAGEDIDVTGTLVTGNVTFAGKARAYGARATIDAAWQFSPPAGGHTGFAGTGTFAGADLRRLPIELRIPPLESQLAGRYNIRMAGGDWNAAVTLQAVQRGGSHACRRHDRVDGNWPRLASATRRRATSTD